MFTINDIIPGVVAKLGNRTDIQDKIPEWCRKTVLELTQSYDFEELKTSGPSMSFTTGQNEYSVNFFTMNNENWTRMTSWFVVIDPSTGIGWEIKARMLMVVEPLSKIQGTPMYWCQHGSVLIVGFNPNVAYGTQQRYQRVHPFTTPQALAGDTVYMPNDWQEVVEYATAMRGASEERMFDYVSRYHDMLYGDEKYRTTRGVQGYPGLIFGLTSKQERNLNQNERQLIPVVPSYGRR